MNHADFKLERMFKRALVVASLGCALPAAGAENCETIRAQIDSKVRASGVVNFTLTTVDAAAKIDGKVVGSCDLGTKKIVYVLNDSPARPPATKSRNEPMLTECKDGSVSVGGDCKK